MVSKNDITGDTIATKVASESYRKNFDRIFGKKDMAEIIPSEDHEQMMFVQWFRRTYEGVLIFAIPNGGHRHPAVAAKLKATGTVSGIPDLFIPAWRLWIEMKRIKGGRVSEEQQDKIDHLKSIGYEVFVTKGCEDAKAQVQEFYKVERMFHGD